jgi:hypothetical protein
LASSTPRIEGIERRAEEEFMTDLVIEHLKCIQADIAELRREVREVKGTCATTLGIVGELIKSEARAHG